MPTMLKAPLTLFFTALFIVEGWSFCFEEASKKYGLNPDLLRAIAKVESGFNKSAINRNSNGSVDIGLMQINSVWLNRLGLDKSKLLNDPCLNINVAAYILSDCIDRHGYTWEAIGCYNAVSQHKRVRYSWKIHNELIKLTNTTKQTQKANLDKEIYLSEPSRQVKGTLIFRIVETIN